MHVPDEARAKGRLEDREYAQWLERNAYSTALLYSALIAVLLPAFHYVLAAMPGVPPDSLALRLVSSACSVAVGAALLLFPALRSRATALQVIQVVVVVVAIDALVVDSGFHNLYIASGLLVIIGAQNAFYKPRLLAAALACGLAFMAAYAAYRGLFWSASSLITLAIYATGYILAFIPASLHMRSQESAVRSRLRAVMANSELEEVHALTHLGKWAQELGNGEIECSRELLGIFGFRATAPAVIARERYWNQVPAEDRAAVERALAESMVSGDEFMLDHRVLLPSGAIAWVQLRGKHEYDDRGKACRRLGTVMDITDRKEAQLSLERLARYDPLTSLPNRTMLYDTLTDVLKERPADFFAILFLDLDRFKDINDTLGHSAGDALLKAVAARLRAVLPADAMVARWGGDEFVAVIPHAGSEDAIGRACGGIVHELAKPFVVGSTEFSIAVSIGVAQYPRDGVDPEVLIRNADTAMYVAKEGAGEPYAFFEPRMHDIASLRHHVQNQLQTALATNGFALYYQPILDAAGGELVGAEALIRWIDASGRIHLPADFIPIAEDIGMILRIGKWVLEAAVSQAVRWRDAGNPLAIAVNISPRQLADPEFIHILENVLRAHGAEPSLLEIEITESGLVPHAEASIKVMAQIKRMGVSIAIDDFGTGYSAFSYLKRLPLDVLKIDRSFVDGIERELDRSIAESIISIGHKLGLTVTAEGVETERQRSVLTGLGCDRLQGYHISHPLPLRDFEEFALTSNCL